MGYDQAAHLRELVARKSGMAAGAPARAGLRTLAVASGKGGVGKTSLTLNLALLLTRQGRQVVVFDADLGMANIDVLLGITPRYTLYDFIRGEKELAEIMVTGPLGLKIIPGSSGVAELANLGQAQRSRVIAALSRLDQEAEIMVIDTSAGISQNVLGFLLASDEVLVVLTPEPTAVTDAYGLIKVLSRYEKQKKIHLVVNRAASEAQAREAAQKIQLVAHTFLGLEPDYLDYIQEDKCVGQAVCSQQPLVLGYPAARASRDMTRLVWRLLGESREAPSVPGTFFQRLLRFLP